MKACCKVLSSLALVGFAVSTALAADIPNAASIDIPKGTGYIWCDVSVAPNAKPLQNMSTASLMSDAERMSSAYIATSCVNLTGMSCDMNSPHTGNKTTDLYWLKSHYLRYEKVGSDNAGTDHLFDCKGRTTGNVQVVVPYNYRVQCHISQTPPTDLQPAKGGAC